MPDEPVAPQPEGRLPQRGARRVRPVVETRDDDLIEVPPELTGLDPETGEPYVEEMHPGHLHTPLCGSRERIVVGVDHTSDARAALRWAAEEARLRHTHLHVVHGFELLSDAEGALRRRDLSGILRALLPTEPTTAEQRDEAAREESDREIRTTLDRALPTLPVDIESLSVDAPAPEALVAASHGAALLVVGHSEDHPNSVARAAAALATCPVAVIPAGCRLGLREPAPVTDTAEAPEPVYDRIVVGVDDSFTGRDALWFAANEAVFRTGQYGGDGPPHPVELLVVDAASPTPSRGPTDPAVSAGPVWDLLEYLVAEVFSDRAVVRGPDLVNITTDVQGAVRRDATRTEPVAERAGFRRRRPTDLDDLEAEGRQGIGDVQSLEERLADEDQSGAVNLQSADPGETLIALSDGADLLVVGIHGHGTGSGARFASVTSDCLRGSTCPVVVVPEAREDENAGIRRASLALEELWTRDRTPTFWPGTNETVGPLAVSAETPEAPSKAR